jgi:hypothetical protein
MALVRIAPDGTPDRRSACAYRTSQRGFFFKASYIHRF